MVAAAFYARRLPRHAFSLLSAFVGLAIFGGFACPPLSAADAGIIKRGDAVVTGFSGTKTDKDVPKDVHPLDRTFIDLGGSSAQVFDLTVLGTAPRGQLSEVPSKLQIKASDTGQVFGVTLDDGQGLAGNGTGAPNAYLTSTSMFGLNIVANDGAGKLTRLLTGARDAQWMPGQFGLDKGGTPGSIWKVDGMTGAVSLFANVKLDSRDNAGAGLGNITFDGKTRQLFVSDLETGMIHRITLDGRERDVFDHGNEGRKAQGLDPVPFDETRRMDIAKPSFNSEDPATWGYADARRRVFGLAVNAGRLYYAVEEGPSVWSVGIDDEGDFGSDARIELEVRDNPSAITDILFDGSGLLYLSQRGSGVGSYDYTTLAAAQKSAVLRYKWDGKNGRWAAVADEYAIGLPKDYRGTQGGVASNYGYDKFGNIDYGKCRQTLWTTGEHLREGGDAVKVATGGAKIVHGLQGNYKSRVRPSNEAPFETWFTDYDSRHADAEAFGHVGDVAIYSPCDAVQERAEAPRLIYADPPVDDPGLIIDKRCYAGAIGGKIRCTITVTNVSGQLPSEDVKVKDVTKVMFGPGAGTIVPIVAFAPSSPGIFCTAVPSLNFSCMIPAVLLLPGLSAGFDVWIETHDLALAGNLGFRNCAVINHPNGWGKACAEGGTDIVVEKIGPGTCIAGGVCKFGLKIANAGLMPYSGDVLLADAMFVGGAVTGAPVTSVVPPIACSAGNTAQLPFTCVTNLSLMPGEEHIHWVTVTMPAPGGYWAQNCFGALDPALMGGGIPPGFGGGGGAGSNPSCVWVNVKAPSANLRLEKTALHGGKCTKAGTDLLCDYEIRLNNENAALFSAPVKLDETVPVGATIHAISAPWACAGGPPAYTCDTGALAVNIPALGSTALNVTVKIPVAASEANLCKVPNTAKITVPPGGLAPNLDPADDSASALAWTLGLFWEDPITHITFVMCDPTNQVVKKVVSTPFVKTGNGFEGEYEVTVTNTGPDPYKGPYKLTEKFGVAPANVSFDGDFVCVGGGTSYSCETPVVEVAVGGRKTLKVKATFADQGTCEAPNTATLTSPVAGSRGNGKGDDDSASATADFASERCTKTRVTPVPPVSRCPDGLPVPRSGKCPCANGGTWNTASRACDDGEREQPQSCTPGPLEYKNSSGQCVCKRGYSRDDIGRCAKDQAETGCEDGSHRAANGSCVPDSNTGDDPARDCKLRGWIWTGKRCIPPSNPADDCKRDGRVWTGSTCIDPVNPAVECRKSGGTWTGSRCDRGPKICPRGQIGNPPNCRDIPVKRCREGTRGVYPNCVVIELPRCPKGTAGTPPNCKTIFIPPKLKINPEIFKPKPKLDVKPQLQQLNPTIKINPQIFQKQEVPK